MSITDAMFQDAEWRDRVGQWLDEWAYRFDDLHYGDLDHEFDRLATDRDLDDADTSGG